MHKQRNTRYPRTLRKGSRPQNTNYIGEAWLNSVFARMRNTPFNITKATFKANSTLNWHKHTDQQVLIIVSGKGYYQEKGKQPILIKQGFFCAPLGEKFIPMQRSGIGKPRRGRKRSAAADWIRRLSDLDLLHLREKK
jgi:mannose-6-phosphate isomerase-like protein (cupin superfamily)